MYSLYSFLFSPFIYVYICKRCVCETLHFFSPLFSPLFSQLFPPFLFCINAHKCAWMLSLHASFMFSLKVLTFVFMRLAPPSSRAYSPPGWYWEDSMLSGGVAPGYSQYSLPGWIVLLVVILALRREVQRSPNPIATQQIGYYDTPYSQYSPPG